MAERGTAVCDSTINLVALFLLYLFNTLNFAYSTLNLVRSSLSFFLGNLINIGSNDYLCRLFKFFFKARPSLPRYLVSWDVNKLLSFLMTWHPSSSLSLEKLTLKTIALVAVSSSDRGQTLEAIDINHSSFTNEGIVFPIYTLLKTSRKNQPVKIVKCIKSSIPELDVCEYVSTYMNRTLKFRLKAVEQGHEKPRQLFLSYFSGKPIKRATISKYLMKVMALAGIDINCFKAHSIRGVFPSLMKEKGFSTHQILSQGDWSRVTTFDRFYNRVPEDSPAGIMIREVAGRRRN